MARKIRIEYPGALYLVSSESKGRRKVFYDDADYETFLNTLGAACEKAGFVVHAFCFVESQFYIVLETPNANLVAGMRWMMSSYTIYLNRRWKRPGTVVSGRYKALIIEGKGDDYLRRACDYVHLIPDRNKILEKDDRLDDYPWSSMLWYLLAPKDRLSWIDTERLFRAYGIHQDNAAGRKRFEKLMEERRESPASDPEWKPFHWGWCFGSARFKQQILDRMEARLKKHRAGKKLPDHGEKRGVEIIREELDRLGWSAGDLPRHRKGDPAKIAIAARLKRETTVSVGWIVRHLHMGTEKSARAILYRSLK